MTNSSDQKCLVVKSQTRRCLVIDDGTVNQPSYRLPLMSEISPEIIKKYTPILLATNLSQISAEEEISPWDLLYPFPPQNYTDYGYMQIDATEKDQYWKSLNEEDKKLIANAQVLPTT